MYLIEKEIQMEIILYFQLIGYNNIKKLSRIDINSKHNSSELQEEQPPRKLNIDIILRDNGCTKNSMTNTNNKKPEAENPADAQPEIPYISYIF